MLLDLTERRMIRRWLRGRRCFASIGHIVASRPGCGNGVTAMVLTLQPTTPYISEAFCRYHLFWAGRPHTANQRTLFSPRPSPDRNRRPSDVLYHPLVC